MLTHRKNEVRQLLLAFGQTRSTRSTLRLWPKCQPGQFPFPSNVHRGLHESLRLRVCLFCFFARSPRAHCALLLQLERRSVAYPSTRSHVRELIVSTPHGQAL